MRSLSRVIKGTDLQISSPRLIQLADIVELKRQQEVEFKHLDLTDNQAVQEIRDETERIIAETEQMVMDLLNRARTESHEILGAASDEADLVRSRALEDAAELKKQAYQEGYEEGLKQAADAMQEQQQQAAQEVQALLHEARETKRRMFKSCEADMLKLSLAVAKRVISTELAANPQIVAGILQEALAYVDQPENVTLYVNQQDVEQVLMLMETNILSDIGSNEVIEVQVDNRITPGGLRLESEAGSVDARLETRVSNVERAFQDVLLDE